MMASKRPVSASFWAASGSSKAPGTRHVWTSSPGTPWRSSARSAPFSRLSVISPFQRATTIAKRAPAAEKLPSTGLDSLIGRLLGSGTLDVIDHFQVEPGNGVEAEGGTHHADLLRAQAAQDLGAG